MVSNKFKLKLAILSVMCLPLTAIASYNVNYNYNNNLTKVINPAEDRANQIKLLEIKQQQYSNELNNKILLDYLSGCPLNSILLGKSGLINDSNLKFINTNNLKTLIQDFSSQVVTKKVNLSEESCEQLYIKRKQEIAKKQQNEIINEYKSPYFAYRLGYSYDTNLDYNYGFSFTNLEFGFRLDSDYTANAHPLYFNLYFDALIHSYTTSFDLGVGFRKDFGLIGTNHPFIQANANSAIYSSSDYSISFGGLVSFGYDFNLFEIELQYKPRIVFINNNFVNKKSHIFSNSFGIYLGFITN